MELPVRKEIRLPEYDYSQPGYYFVTICTAVRNRDVLCSIHTPYSSANVGVAALGDPQIILTTKGKVIDQYIRNIDLVYNGQITVDQYVIMPDHVHLIVCIQAQEDGSPRAATPTVSLPQVINTLKGLTTKKLGRFIWQRGYYDHVIRNDADLHETRLYIQSNPLNRTLNKD